jgi:hypothetical protein
MGQLRRILSGIALGVFLVVIGAHPRVFAQEAGSSSARQSGEAVVTRCAAGGRITAACISTENRRLMEEAGQAMLTGLQNLGPDYRDIVEQILEERSLGQGGLAGDSARMVLLGIARGGARTISGSRAQWSASDSAAATTVRQWLANGCDPAGAGTSVSSDCSAQATALQLQRVCGNIESGAFGGCARRVLPLLQEQLQSSSAALNRANDRLASVSSMLAACGSSQVEKEQGACVGERTLQVTSEVAYRSVRDPGARAGGGGSGATAGTAGDDRRSSSGGSSGSTDDSGSAVAQVGGGGGGGGSGGQGSRGEGSGGGGDSTTESGDGRARRDGGSATARIEGAPRGDRTRLGGSQQGREGGTQPATQDPNAQQGDSRVAGAQRGRRGSSGTRVSTSAGVDHGPASEFLRDLLGIKGSDDLAELFDLAAREERADMMACPQYVGTSGVPACTRDTADPAQEITAAATDPTLMTILASAGSERPESGPTSASVEPFQEVRFYETVVQRELDSILSDYESLLNRPGASEAVITFLRGIQNSCGGNSRLSRHFSSRIANMLSSRGPDDSAEVARQQRVLQARVADLNAIDADIHALQAEFFDPSKSAEYNSRELTDYLNSTMGMLLPCGSIIRGANSVLGAFRQAANATSSCRIRNVAGVQFILPFESPSADAEIARNLERIITGDRSWRPTDGAVSTVTCNLAATTVEDCRRSCTGGSESDRILYCQRTSWPSDQLQMQAAAEAGDQSVALNQDDAQGALPPVVPAARSELSARERCQSKFDLLQGLLVRRAMLMADYPELGHEVNGVPAYRRFASGGVTFDRLRSEANQHFSDLSRDRSSWFSQAAANEVGVRVAIGDMCRNPRAAAEAIMADPDHMGQVLSCGRQDSLPVRPTYDPIVMDPSADPACRYLRAYAPQMCGTANRLAYNRMSRASYIDTLLHGPMTALDVMACGTALGGIARIGAASVRLASTVARVGLSQGMRSAAQTALVGVGRGVLQGARLTVNQAVETVTSAHSMAMLGALGGYGWVTGTMGAETIRRQLNDQILACSRGQTDACGEVTQLREEYEVMARSAGAEGLAMILAGVLIPGGVGDEIPTVTRTLEEARVRVRESFGRVSDFAESIRTRGRVTSEQAQQLRVARQELADATRAAERASRRLGEVVGSARRRAQEPILTRLREQGLPEAEVRRRSGLLLDENGEPVTVPGPGGRPRTIGLNEIPTDMAEVIASGRGARGQTPTTTAGRTAAGRAANPDELLAVDGSVRPQISRLRDRLTTFFGSGPMRGRAPPAAPTEVLPRVASAVQETVRLVSEGRISPEEGARVIREARLIQEEFLPVLDRTLRTRFRYTDEDIASFISDSRRRLRDLGDGIRTREDLAAAVRALDEDPSVILTRSLADQDSEGRPTRYCEAERSAGCGQNGCPCSETCRIR